MPTTDSSTRQRPRPEQAATAGLTAFVALLLLALAWLVPLETRNASGERREMNALDVWREMLNHLPADAPVFLNADVLAVLSVVALVLSAYVIVAIARLPR